MQTKQTPIHSSWTTTTARQTLKDIAPTKSPAITVQNVFELASGYGIQFG